MAQSDAESGRIVIAVDLDYFFAQCEEIRNPDYKSKPIVVCVFSGRTETSGAVSTANYLARELGVKSGIPIVNAKRLLANHPEAIFLPVDHQYYETVSERVMDIVKSSSSGSPFEQASIDEAYLDVSESSNGDFERAARIAQDLKTELKIAEGLSATLGVGPNKLIAKMATDSKKPDGFGLVGAEEVRNFLKDLPVRKLIGIGPRIEDKMASLGIKTIGDLADFDAAVLSESFGRHLGPQLKKLAQGRDDDPVTARPIEQLSRIVTLKEDANTYSFQDQMIPLARDISQRLSTLGFKCRSVGIIAITTGLKTKARGVTLESPTDSYDEISSIASGLFEGLFRSGNQRIRRAGLRVSGFDKETREVGWARREEERQETLSSFFSPAVNPKGSA